MPHLRAGDTEFCCRIHASKCNVYEMNHVENIGVGIAVDIGSDNWTLGKRINIRRCASKSYVDSSDNIKDVCGTVAGGIGKAVAIAILVWWRTVAIVVTVRTLRVSKSTKDLFVAYGAPLASAVLIEINGIPSAKCTV